MAGGTPANPAALEVAGPRGPEPDQAACGQTSATLVMMDSVSVPA